MTQTDTRVAPRAGTGRSAAVKVVAAWIILPLFFLATGGTLRWWQAWVYCVVLLVPATLFIAYMVRRDPEFVARRSKVRESERTQRRIIPWGYPPVLAAFIIPGLDHRFGWSDPPLALVTAAMAIVLGGYLSILRVFVENRWAGRTIETYADQQVITTGPYALVRHPMYAASVALYAATPLALGSWWGVLPALALVPLFVLRIHGEEEVLVRELPGYDEYRGRVRYKLLPFIW